MNRLMLLILISFWPAHLLAESLWKRSAEPIQLFTDIKARRAGDLVTILIEEQSEFSAERDNSLKKDSATKAGINVFRLLGIEKPADGNGTGGDLPAVDWESSRSFAADGSTETKDKLVLRITATVREQLPNGNLLIEGEREMIANQEVRILRIAGIVRPRDITADNTIRSESIAEAKIHYQSKGPLATNGRKGLPNRFLDMIWPF